jgi:hypothetical protein
MIRLGVLLTVMMFVLLLGYSNPAESNLTATLPATEITTREAASTSILWETLPQQTINDQSYRLYAVVTRTDGTYRHMYIAEQALSAYTPGEPLPLDTIFVMETYYAPEVEGTNFTKRLTSQGFEYGSFNPANPNLTTRRNSSCSACHRSAEDPSGTFTLPMLDAALVVGVPMITECNQSGRTPCDHDVYLNASEVN